MLKISKRKLFSGLFALGLGLTMFGAAQAQDALSNIMAAKVVKIGIPTDFPPYGFVGPDLKPQGLDVEFANYLGAKMGVKVELIPVSSPNRIPYLQSKRTDLVISTLGKTPDREKVIDFSKAYAPYFQAVYGPKSLVIKSFADLAGKSVAVTRGALEGEALEKLAPPTTDIKRFEDNNATVSAYVSGQVPLIGTGNSVAETIMQRNPQLTTEFKLLLAMSACYVGIPKGEDALRAKVDEIIIAAKANGDIEKLAQKWLKSTAADLPK